MTDEVIYQPSQNLLLEWNAQDDKKEWPANSLVVSCYWQDFVTEVNKSAERFAQALKTRDRSETITLRCKFCKSKIDKSPTVGLLFYHHSALSFRAYRLRRARPPRFSVLGYPANSYTFTNLQAQFGSWRQGKQERMLGSLAFAEFMCLACEDFLKKMYFSKALTVGYRTRPSDTFNKDLFTNLAKLDWGDDCSQVAKFYTKSYHGDLVATLGQALPLPTERSEPKDASDLKAEIDPKNLSPVVHKREEISQESKKEPLAAIGETEVAKPLLTKPKKKRSKKRLDKS